MAFTTQAKIFLNDLSNYAEIRRGLSPAMRKATPTLTQLKKADAETREGLINALNDWRSMNQSAKIKSARGNQKGPAVFITAAGADYYTANQKIKLITAGIKLKSMSPDEAYVELREAISVSGRLHNRDFYKAQYFLDRGTWDTAKATNEMLTEIVLTGGILNYDEKTIITTLKAYIEKNNNINADDQKAINEEITKLRTETSAQFYNDMLNVGRIITG